MLFVRIFWLLEHIVRKTLHLSLEEKHKIRQWLHNVGQQDVCLMGLACKPPLE